MRIDSNRLSKELIVRERERLLSIPGEKHEDFIDAYSAGASDVIELVIEQINEQLEENK